MRLRRGVRRSAREFESAGGKSGSGELLGEYEELIRKKLKCLSYAPIVFLSAKPRPPRRNFIR